MVIKAGSVEGRVLMVIEDMRKLLGEVRGISGLSLGHRLFSRLFLRSWQVGGPEIGEVG